MPRLQSHVKKVACLEGDWDGWQDKSTVTPILQLVSGQVKRFDYFHRRLSSEGEFLNTLQRIGRANSFQLIYFAFHGTRGTIMTDSFEFSLSELADYMGQQFAGRVIHFGSCSTLRVNEHEIQDFLIRTEAAMVTGYTKDVDWVESSAFELLYFYLWQDFKNTGSFAKRLLSDYGDLAKRLGFVSFTPA